MSAENFVGSLSTGDNLGAETAFKDEMTSRVADARRKKKRSCRYFCKEPHTRS